MPKNKNSDDAWVKGAEFIDLVSLGTKKTHDSQPKSEAVYIKPAGGSILMQNNNQQ